MTASEKRVEAPQQGSQQQGQQLVPTFNFDLPPAVEMCSSNVCAAGHRWKPKLGIGTCPGCAAPVLMAMLQQCPVCNEPCVRTELRNDHIANGGGVAAVCKGQRVVGECVRVELERRLWEEVEQGSVQVVPQAQAPQGEGAQQ